MNTFWQQSGRTPCQHSMLFSSALHYFSALLTMLCECTHIWNRRQYICAVACRLYDSLKEVSLWDVIMSMSPQDWLQRMQRSFSGRSDTVGTPRSVQSASGRLEREKQPRRFAAMKAASSTLLKERRQFAEELLAAHAPSMLIPFMFK